MLSKFSNSKSFHLVLSENEINVRYAYQIGDRYWDSVTKSEERDASPPAKIPRKEVDPVLTRTGGAYIPPAKLRMMQAQITDKSSLAFQRLAWEALKKSIHGLINKINISNIAQIIGKLFRENIVRARGLLSRSIMQAQAASPTFTHVYASLVAVINSKVNYNIMAFMKDSSRLFLLYSVPQYRRFDSYQIDHPVSPRF